MSRVIEIQCSTPSGYDSPAAGFADFRKQAKPLLLDRVSPNEVRFFSGAIDNPEQPSFDIERSMKPVDSSLLQKASGPARTLTVTPAFLKLADAVCHFQDVNKWNLLYRILYRLQYENRRLLEIAIDDDIRQAEMMQKAVKREIHKIHAFVRFEKIPALPPEEGDTNPAPLETYLAWMDTDHPVLELAAPFFERRFGDRTWAILTPLGSAYWDGQELTYGEGVATAPPRSGIPR